MIDQMAEGRSYHALKYLLDHREAYLYPFYPSCEVLGSLNAFRYQQDKLSDDDVQFYPSQLVILARYYLFHHQVPGRETAGMSLEETRRAMLEWIASLQGALMALSGKPITNASTHGYARGRPWRSAASRSLHLRQESERLPRSDHASPCTILRHWRRLRLQARKASGSRPR